MDFLEFLKKETNNKYDFVKLVEVKLSENNACVCKFIYDGNVRDLDENDKSLFSGVVNKYVGVDCDVVIKFKKESLDNDVIFQYVSTFIQTNFPSAFSIFKPENLMIENDDLCCKLKISMIDIYFKYLKAKNFEKELEKYLSKYYFKNFNVELSEINSNNSIEDALIEQENIIQGMVDETNLNKNIENFNVLEVTKLIGEELNSECRFFDSLRKPVKNIVTAGKIKQIYEKTFKSKTAKNEDGTPKEKAYYNFKLELRGEILDCVYFPKDTDLAKFQTLNENDEIVINGDIEEFNNRTNCKVKQISLCKLPKIDEVKVEFKKVNDVYKYVQPCEYVVEEQPDIFSFNKVDEVNDILKNNTFVVYDFETTGLNFMENEIIEIGAVKIIDGKIKETFDTFVKPQKISKLPMEIVKLTHITDEMVKDSYTISEVIQDFYKFCYGSIMVGHNSIGFDNLFLQKAGRENKYNFDNKQLDTYIIALQQIKGIKNYKLKTIAEYLNVKLENAHRAINDVLATAEVFIKLTDKMNGI